MVTAKMQALHIKKSQTSQIYKFILHVMKI